MAGHNRRDVARPLGRIIGTSCNQELDDAVRLVARNADSLTEAQRAELIAALAKR